MASFSRRVNCCMIKARHLSPLVGVLMRSLVLSIVSSLVLGASVPAFAECYGDAANQYGCNNGSQETSNRGSGELVRFGGESERVLPDNGYANTKRSATDDLFTPEEQRQMLKSIVTGSGSSYSRGAFTRSMQAGARPLRSFGNRGIVTRSR